MTVLCLSYKQYILYNMRQMFFMSDTRHYTQTITWVKDETGTCNTTWISAQTMNECTVLNLRKMILQSIYLLFVPLIHQESKEAGTYVCCLQVRGRICHWTNTKTLKFTPFGNWPHMHVFGLWGKPECLEETGRTSNLHTEGPQSAKRLEPRNVVLLGQS